MSISSLFLRFKLFSRSIITLYPIMCTKVKPTTEKVYLRYDETGPDSTRVLRASTPIYHAADKHDTPPSHFYVYLVH